MELVLSQTESDVFVPDGSDLVQALERTTHLAIGAHQDDLELMAAHGILECFGSSERWFTGVVVTDGGGSPRAHAHAQRSDAELARVRRQEQRKAALIGEYSAMLQLAYPSRVVKEREPTELLSELARVIELARPDVIYTHNLADKHDTHVAVALRVVAACLMLPEQARPSRLIGCEVWRDLDWLCDDDKVVMPVDSHEHLQTALMAVFDSQLGSGKRYDLATMGRRRAHATYFESHATDRHSHLIWGMDLRPLLEGADPALLTRRYIERFEAEVLERIGRFSSGG